MLIINENDQMEVDFRDSFENQYGEDASRDTLEKNMQKIIDNRESDPSCKVLFDNVVSNYRKEKQLQATYNDLIKKGIIH